MDCTVSQGLNFRNTVASRYGKQKSYSCTKWAFTIPKAFVYQLCAKTLCDKLQEER